MPLTSRIDLHELSLSESDQRRIDAHLAALARRLQARPEPTAVLGLYGHSLQRRVSVDLRVELGPLGPTLCSHQAAETADLGVKRAIDDIQRQLERHVAEQRGERSFGVPSRREPKQARPHPPS